MKILILESLQNARSAFSAPQSLAEAGKTPLIALCSRLQRHEIAGRTLDLGNHATRTTGLVGLANDFTVLQDDWIQIAPYGDYFHEGPRDKSGNLAKGRDGKVLYPYGVIQRLNPEAGAEMVANFNSLIRRATAALTNGAPKPFGGLPWYRGHHDIDPIKYPDDAAYGWIMELANRADGVYGKVKWTPAGEKLKTDGSFKYFSPYWDGKDTGLVDATTKSVICMPNVLRSVAFTNNPNIPVMPLANETEFFIAAPYTEEQAEIANLLFANAVLTGRLKEEEKADWETRFQNNFAQTMIELANYGTSAGAKKGWETRKGGMGSSPAAKVAAKRIKTRKAGAAPKPSAEVKSHNLTPDQVHLLHLGKSPSDPQYKADLKAASAPKAAKSRKQLFDQKESGPEAPHVRKPASKASLREAQAFQKSKTPPPIPKAATSRKTSDLKDVRVKMDNVPRAVKGSSIPKPPPLPGAPKPPPLPRSTPSSWPKPPKIELARKPGTPPPLPAVGSPERAALYARAAAKSMKRRRTNL